MTPVSTTAFSINAAAQEAAEHVAAVEGSRHWSFRELALRTNGVRQWLRQAGATPHRTRPVAFPADNSIASICTLLALFEEGTPAFLLHPRTPEAETVRTLKALPTSDRSPLRIGPLALNTRLEAAVLPPLDAPPAEADIMAVVQTSGSTGGARGVELSRGAFLHSALASAGNLGWQADDRWLLSIPLAHVGGLSIVCRCLQARVPFVLCPSRLAGDGAAMRDLIVQSEVSLVSLVPTQLERLWQACASGQCPPSVRAILLGGAHAPASLVAKLKHQGWPILTTYGSTETCAQVVTQSYGARFIAEQSVGTALAGVDLRVAADGRLEVRSQSLFSGYFPDQEPSLSADGYFLTSDLAALSQDGQLRILGRADDVIISGGENVLPQEVEACLLAHPSVRDAVVLGVPDPRWGHRVCAVVSAPERLTPTAMRLHCKQRLAAFKVPKTILWLDELPRLANQKPDRNRLRSLLALVTELEG